LVFFIAIQTLIVLSSAYFAPVQYFCKIACSEQVLVEAHDYYVKQTYRSRCRVLGANGVITLSVPVEKTHGKKMPIRDVRIDYRTPWQRLHWRSLVSAYGASPFFMYYADELEPVFRRRETFLFDLNLKATQLVCELLHLKAALLLTEAYRQAWGDAALDFRQRISPKLGRQQPDSSFAPASYYQVFAHRFGFTPNLSVLDLLFNEGTEAPALIKKSACSSGKNEVSNQKLDIV
jgi:hypothetical protein